MKRRPLVFIEHILESIENIESFSSGISKGEFEKSRLKQSAILRELEIIGEAAKNLPIGFAVRYPYVEWSEIAGTRDKIVRHYFGVDLDVIWDIIMYDLPELKAKILKILEELEKEERKRG